MRATTGSQGSRISDPGPGRERRAQTGARRLKTEAGKTRKAAGTRTHIAVPGPTTAPHRQGLMFWFNRKRFVGSYFFFNAASRS